MKTKTTVKSTDQLLRSECEQLARLFKKTQELQYLNQLLQIELEPNMRPHCQIANLNQHCLHVTVDSSTWAMRLRYNAPELLKALQLYPGLKDVQSIKVHIQLKTEASPMKNRPLPLSADSAKLILATANNIRSSVLKSALEKLATHQKPEY